MAWIDFWRVLKWYWKQCVQTHFPSIRAIALVEKNFWSYVRSFVDFMSRLSDVTTTCASEIGSGRSAWTIIMINRKSCRKDLPSMMDRYLLEFWPQLKKKLRKIFHFHIVQIQTIGYEKNCSRNLRLPWKRPWKELRNEHKHDIDGS